MGDLSDLKRTSDVLIENPVCIQDLEDRAFKTLPRQVVDYYRSGADGETTLGENVNAFKRYLILPRLLRDVSKLDMTTSVLGTKIDFPVCVSPTAMQRMAHPSGEIATAKGTKAVNTLMVLSTISTTSVEDVAMAAPGLPLWFQVYIYKDRTMTERLVRRAVRTGFRALVLTVDTPAFGRRLADIRNNFSLPAHLKLANFEGLESKVDGANSGSGLQSYATSLFDSSLTWPDIRWLKQISNLPIIAKGILTPEDAILALEHGVDAILVSNHGARQLDYVPATLDALPGIVRAVNGRCEVYVDGGIRTGTDCFKALAIGARAVFVGRPVLWGLAYKGAEGVEKALNILKEELSIAMSLSGCSSVADIKPEMVAPTSVYYQQSVLAKSKL